MQLANLIHCQWRQMADNENPGSLRRRSTFTMTVVSVGGDIR